jgi:hypothetical protein
LHTQNVVAAPAYLQRIDTQNENAGLVATAEASLTLMALDISILEPSDALLWKWAGYTVVAIAAGTVIYLHKDEVGEVIHTLNARKPKNALPDVGPPDGTLERVDPHTGELLQERIYAPDGTPDIDIDWNHDHGQGIPHIHEWFYPSPQAPNKKRGKGRGIAY